MRNIIWSDEFAVAVKAFGGHRAIDQALEAVIDGLTRNPYGFALFESDFTTFRYAMLASTSRTPALIITFRIEGKGKDVILEHIMEDEG